MAVRIISINLQHYLWGELFGYLTHPNIPILDPHLRIADIGTGTGLVLDIRLGRLLLTTRQHLAHRPRGTATQIRTFRWAGYLVPCNTTTAVAPFQHDAPSLGRKNGRSGGPR